MDAIISEKALAEQLLQTIARDHLEGRRSDLNTLTEELGLPRADVRSMLSELHRQGFVDVLRMRLTLEGFAIGLSLLDREDEAFQRDSLAA